MIPKHFGPKQIIYQNQYQQIYSVHIKFEDFSKELYVNDYGQRVGLVIDHEGEILLVRQYRYLVNGLAWEIPGGKLDAGESPEQAAVREGLEETCLRCRTLKPLLYFHPGLDTFDNPTYLFYCNDFERMPMDNLHRDEISHQTWLPLTQCIKMIFERQIVDSLTIAGLLALQTLRSNPDLRVS